MSSTRRPLRRFAKAVLAVTVLAAVLAIDLVAPTPAAAATPTIENNGGNEWLETFSVPKDTNGERIRVTFLVRHDPGRRVTGLAVDDNWDGTDNTFSVTPDAVSAQQAAAPFNYSRVSHSFIPPNQPGFSCPVFGTRTRRVNNTLRIRAVLDNGERTAVVSSNVHSVENSQCLASTDFPYLRDQSQNLSSVTPGQVVRFTFQGDDVDSSGGNSEFAKYRYRVRRLNDGAITEGPTFRSSCGDNCNNILDLDFPQRGRYVVEAELGGEDDPNNGPYENSGRFFYIGAVDVNGPTSATNLTLTGAPAIAQQGDTFTVTANIADADFQGRGQIIEWDADGNGSFERREIASVEGTGLTLPQRQQFINTAGETGTITIRARATDNGALNAADNIRRIVTKDIQVAINRPPVAEDQDVTTPEDTPETVTLNGTDPDGDPLTFTVTGTGPANGTLTGSGATRNYTPDPDYFGPDSFTFSVDDGRGGTDTGTVSIEVTPVNDAPVTADQDLNTQEDTPVPFTLSATDVDNTAAELSFAVDDPANGTVDCTGPTGADCAYTPDSNFNGSEIFGFTVSDGDGGSDTGTITVLVLPVNDPAMADDQTVTTDEDTAVAVTLTGDDPEGDPLEFDVATDPVNGTLTGTAPNLTYTPDGDFNGTDSFLFTVSDGTGEADTGEVTIVVNPVNDAPVAADQDLSTDEEAPLGLTLSAADIDDDDADLTYDADQPANGTVACTGAECTYTPDPDFNGSDSFTFTATDPDGLSDTATVTIAVNPVNDAPVTDDQTVTTPEDTAVDIDVTATDVDGDDLAYTVSTDPVNGTVDCSGADCTYTPNLNFFGDDSFTVTATDPGGLSDSALISIAVTPVNDAPVAEPQFLTTGEDEPLTITLNGTDVDNEGGELTYSAAAPANGTLDCTGATCTYTPDLDYNGPDSFEFTVTDSDGATGTATVEISVAPVNDPPIATDATVTTDEDTPVDFTLTADDVDGDTLAFAVSTFPGNGELDPNPEVPDLTYTPVPNFNGTDTFTFVVEDSAGGRSTGTITLVVNPVNDAPVAADQSVTVTEDEASAITLSATDPDGDALTYAVDSGPTNGTVACTGPDCIYTPAADYNGPDSFTFTVDDGNGGTDSATVTINVAPAALFATTLTAHPLTLRLLNIFQSDFTPALRATLVRTDTGAPLPGRTIAFSTGGQPLCTATTNSVGVASCGARVSIATILNLGYDARFDGDFDHAPSAGRAFILIIRLGLF